MAKKKLLDEGGIVVWRNHDFMHFGIPQNGRYIDGVFYGIAKLFGWENYRGKDERLVRIFEFPQTTVADLAQELIAKFGLNGLRIIGALENDIKKVGITMHIIGEYDKEILKNQ